MINVCCPIYYMYDDAARARRRWEGKAVGRVAARARPKRKEELFEGPW